MITDEMIDWFEQRTHRHINLVNKHIQMYFGDNIPYIIARENHDASKLREPELTPYIWITWNYHCKDLGINPKLPSNMKEEMNKATEHHVKTNRHHPEYWSDRNDNLIPKNDRDKFDPTLIPTIHIDSMPEYAIIEMCADWCAMSEERSNTPQEWYSKVIGKRWDFGTETNSFILQTLNRMWR